MIRVYFNKEKSMINADVEFFVNRIKEYEKVLNLEPNMDYWKSGMDIKQLSRYFDRDISTVRKAIAKMCKADYYYDVY